jgi:NAD(P)-dependent dehydrogenase (short-subunit alcohol dehydrogenase family)
MIADLEGRTALVTGCLGGIGGASCKALAEAGATVIGADLSKEGADWVMAAQGRYLNLDVSSEDGWSRLVSHVEREFGQLDILVNNAGITAIDRIEATSLDDWRRMMATNVEGTFLGTKACLPLLRRTGELRPFGAAIVNISSIAGIVGIPYSACYSASKGAVRLFTKSSALEFSHIGYKIRVNSVHPGVVQTPMADEINARYVETGLMSSSEKAVARMPRPLLGRTAIPDDIAKAVRFLASDESGYMNGTELIVDGGFTAK